MAHVTTYEDSQANITARYLTHFGGLAYWSPCQRIDSMRLRRVRGGFDLVVKGRDTAGRPLVFLWQAPLMDDLLYWSYYAVPDRSCWITDKFPGAGTYVRRS